MLSPIGRFRIRLHCLSFLSAVAQQLIDYIRDAGLLPDLQSAYWAFHSTETAVLKVISDILWAIDNGNLSLLALLDLSSAFDTVDHEILLSSGRSCSCSTRLTSYGSVRILACTRTSTLMTLRCTALLFQHRPCTCSSKCPLALTACRSGCGQTPH